MKHQLIVTARKINIVRENMNFVSARKLMARK